jgi:hypothetical protein
MSIEDKNTIESEDQRNRLPYPFLDSLLGQINRFGKRVNIQSDQKQESAAEL